MTTGYTEDCMDIRDYMNIDELENELYGLYKECLDETVESEESSVKDHLLLVYDYEGIKEEAAFRADCINNNMRKYLHQDNHHIDGNFMNVERNYMRDHKCSRKDFENMVKRLDSGDMSEESKEDREWLRSWFWEAFGTFGLTYNFKSELDDCIYEYERENKIFCY